MSTVQIRLVTDEDIPRADQDQLRSALLAWRDEVPNPLIPHDVDVDGDGFVDCFGLSAEGQLVFVSGAPLEATVFAATGGDVETGGE